MITKGRERERGPGVELVDVVYVREKLGRLFMSN